MPLFDAYSMVDWSASSRPSREKNPDNSIWIAWAERASSWTETSNPRTRNEAHREVETRLRAAHERNLRVLVGFDFAYSYQR